MLREPYAGYFDDAALLTAAQLEATCNSSTLAAPPPYAITGAYQPVTALAGLNGTSPNGTWTMTIQDFVGGDGGSLQTWSLELITDCTVNLGLTQTFIQGYMNGSAMQPVLQNSMVLGANGSQCNTIHHGGFACSDKPLFTGFFQKDSAECHGHCNCCLPSLYGEQEILCGN